MKSILITFLLFLTIAGDAQSKEMPLEKKCCFEIEGQSVTLINGVEEKSVVPGSASKRITRYFGNELRADLNGDGKQDHAFVVTQTGGGSGTFYYLVAMFGKVDGSLRTASVLLGDRIAPKTTELIKGEEILIEVNYADRKEGEPFATAPSVGRTKRFKVSNEKLMEITQ